MPYLDRDEVFRQAEYYQASGADVIDLGCSLDRKLEDAAEVIARLKARGSGSASTPSTPTRSWPPTGPGWTTC